MLAIPAVSSAQVLYQSDLSTETGSNWTTLTSSANSDAAFAFDYSSLGIPQAPGSTSLHALRLRANTVVITAPSTGAVQGVTVVPKSLNLTGDYHIQATVWMNSVGPFPNGGTGSTQFFGLGSGFSGTSPTWRGGSATGGGAGTWFAADGEGGFSNTSTTVRDYSAFKGSGATAANFIIDATAYKASGGNASSTTAQDNANSYYGSITTGTDVAQVNNGDLATAQNAIAADPSGPQTGTTANGSPAFAWRVWDIVRTGNTVTWSIDNLPIATLSGTNVGTLNGNIDLTYFDATSSAGDPNLLFALVSNVTVTVPEPASLSSVALLGSGLLLRRRRRE